MDQHDHLVRQSAFDFLVELTERYGDVLPREKLAAGFIFEGVRVPLLAPQGIFKPRILELPLTIATAPDGPYDDAFTDDDYRLLHYKYRGTDIYHRDNVGLRKAMAEKVPLIYLHGLVPGKYMATWPVYVVADDPARLTFTVAVDDKLLYPDERIADISVELETSIRRRYVTTETRVRLHQRVFRERVIRAYREQCAMCRLRHQELLDAAHIIPDSDEMGEPKVTNGISLCKIHHAAFDKNILGIRPDLVVEIRVDVLNEADGPMLRHGLQEMHGTKLHVPQLARLQPDTMSLEQRYQEFRDYIPN